MTNIETWEALDRTIAITAVLAEHRARLEEHRDTYDLEDLARFVILEAGETIETLVPPGGTWGPENLNPGDLPGVTLTNRCGTST